VKEQWVGMVRELYPTTFNRVLLVAKLHLEVPLFEALPYIRHWF
jgi:hypothetical protein